MNTLAIKQSMGAEQLQATAGSGHGGVRAALARTKPLHALFAGALLSVVALWAGLALYLTFEQEIAREAAEKTAASFARALEEHTLNTIRSIDQTTVFVKSEYERIGTRLDLTKYARQGVFLPKFFNLIGVISADGWFRISDRPLPSSNLSDREHFKIHVERDTAALYISRPVLGRSSGKWSIQFTRRINAPDGSFGGVVVASLDPGYFNAFYDSIDIGERGVVTLVGEDGIVRARSDGGKSDVGQDLRSSPMFKEFARSMQGSYYSTSSIDGVRRLISFRRMPDYPLVVAVGMSEETVLADYVKHRNVILGLGLFISLLLAAGAISVGLHLHSRQQVELALRRSEQEAISSSRMKSEFIARTSHELRTPLNGIIGFAEFLRDTEESPEKRECAATIYDSSMHLLTLVNSILDLAKIEAGHMEVRRIPVEVPPLVKQAVDIQRAFAGQKNLSLDTEIAPDTPDTIQGDPTRVLQVLNNLLHNAIKFTDAGGVTLRVSARDDSVLFAVADTGPGIKAADMEALFQRFRQVDSFDRRSQQGTGLGLALARDLVELMGGHIWVESTPGEGSTFYFTLPRVRETA